MEEEGRGLVTVLIKNVISVISTAGEIDWDLLTFWG